MFTFKLADDPGEIEQIQALHYRTFVEEIPQHGANAERRHVDKFHDQNVYVIALKDSVVVGSLAVRDRRPFSLDAKLPNLDQYLPPDRRPCEVRLLAIEKEQRTGPVLPGMLSVLWEYAMARKFDCALISGTIRQLKLYRHFGFQAFGPLVGTAEASFQPMILTLEGFQQRAPGVAALPAAMRGETASFLPGPVAVHPGVAAAFRETPQSHRGETFLDDMRAVQSALSAMTGARYAHVLLGSGTLANDAVAAQLSLLGARGVVFSNGEFGERLADHATRARLDFGHVRVDWGAPLPLGAIGDAAWVWLVACETSTGVMNDVAAAVAVCRERGVKLCIDAVSAIGAVPLDLSGVWLASGASGKALAAYPGLSMVFHNHELRPALLPRYLDLALYAASEGVPFTHSSNLVRALRVALEHPRRYEEIAATGSWLRRRLLDAGFALVGAGIPAPHIVTIAVSDSASAARSLQRAGFSVSWASAYLRERNWIQIAVMGEVTRGPLTALLRELTRNRTAYATATSWVMPAVSPDRRSALSLPPSSPPSPR